MAFLLNELKGQVSGRRYSKSFDENIKRFVSSTYNTFCYLKNGKKITANNFRGENIETNITDNRCPTGINGR